MAVLAVGLALLLGLPRFAAGGAPEPAAAAEAAAQRVLASSGSAPQAASFAAGAQSGLAGLGAAPPQTAEGAAAAAPRGLVDLGAVCDLATNPTVGKVADFVFGEGIESVAALAAGAVTEGIGAGAASFATKLIGEVAKVGVTEFVLPSVCDKHVRSSTGGASAGEVVKRTYTGVLSDIGLRRGAGDLFTQSQELAKPGACTKYPQRATFCSAIGHSHDVPSAFSDAVFVDLREAQVEAAFTKMKLQDTMAKVMGKHRLCAMAVMDAICLEGFPVCEASTLTPCVMACRNIKECFMEAFPSTDEGSLDGVVETCQAQCKASIEESLSDAHAGSQTVTLPTTASEPSRGSTPTVDGFGVGDRVMVRRGIIRPRFGWGDAQPTSVGRISAVHGDGLVTVAFAEDPSWNSIASELEHVWDGTETCAVMTQTEWLKSYGKKTGSPVNILLHRDSMCMGRTAVNHVTDDIPSEEWDRREDNSNEIADLYCHDHGPDGWLTVWAWNERCHALFLCDTTTGAVFCLRAWGIGKPVYVGTCPSKEEAGLRRFWWPHINGTIESYAFPGYCLQSTAPAASVGFVGSVSGKYILAPCWEGTHLTAIYGNLFDAANKFSLGGVMLGTVALSGHTTAGVVFVLVLSLLPALAGVAAVSRARRRVAVEPAGMAQATCELLLAQDAGEAVAPEDGCA